MPIVMNMEWPGVTKEQYDAARRVVNMDAEHPKGLLFHVAAFDDKGIRVTDLWDSAEAFQTYADTRLMPAVQQVGMQGQPNVEICPVHALLTPGFHPA